MGFWSMLEVSSMPILQVLMLSLLGAFMATDYSNNLLSADTRRSLNKIVFMVFTPSLIFSSLAKTVTLSDIISWWFMPINIGLTFLIGGILGWILVKILRLKPHIEGLVIASCSSGNLGNLMLIIVPAICNEDKNPFGDSSTCSSIGLSYASFSMALGGFYIWTYTYQLVKTSAAKFKALEAEENLKEPNKNLEATQTTPLLKGDDYHQHVVVVVQSTKSVEDTEIQSSACQEETTGNRQATIWSRLLGFLHQILEELMAPPTLAATAGLVFGATTFLKNLIIGENAPLRVIQDSLKLLGNGTIPCITLILGGNLLQGLRSARIRVQAIVGVVCVRYVLLPAIGIWIVKTAANLGFLPSDPLFQFVLMIQYTLPPAMNIGTMTQLFDAGQEECSVLFLWTYLVAALALTLWSTIFMSFLS